MPVYESAHVPHKRTKNCLKPINLNTFEFKQIFYNDKK